MLKILFRPLGFSPASIKNESIAKWLSQALQLIELQLIVLHNSEYSAVTSVHMHVWVYEKVCVSVSLSYKSLFILGKLLQLPSYISFNL